MVSKILKRCSAIFLICLLLAAVSGCGMDPSEDGSDVNMINVTLSILYSQDEVKDETKDETKDKDVIPVTNVENYSMQVQEEATILQILESYSDQEGIDIQVSDSDNPYITSINGVSGWTCQVNGKDVTKDIEDYKAKNGDTIQWTYFPPDAEKN